MTADTDPVLQRALTTVSLIACLLLVASFALFAHDQVAGASVHQQNELAADAAMAPSAPTAPHTPGQPRRFIDAAAGRLDSPFASVVHSNNPWVDHGLPTLFGLIVYGLGLRFIARFSSGRGGAHVVQA